MAAGEKGNLLCLIMMDMFQVLLSDGMDMEQSEDISFDTSMPCNHILPLRAMYKPHTADSLCDNQSIQ